MLEHLHKSPIEKMAFQTTDKQLTQGNRHIQKIHHATSIRWCNSVHKEIQGIFCNITNSILELTFLSYRLQTVAKTYKIHQISKI